MRKSRLVICGVAVLLVLTAAVAVVVLWPRDELSARETAETYFAAQVDGDVEEMCALLTNEKRDELVRCEMDPDDEWVEAVRWLSHTVDDVEEMGDEATVHYSVVDAHPSFAVALTSTGTLRLVKVDGAWRVQDIEIVADDFPTSHGSFNRSGHADTGTPSAT